MQKFTVFSIILSLVVVLTITDLLFHDYLNRNTETVETTPVEDPVNTDDDLVDMTISPSDTDISGGTVTDISDTPVELQSESGLPSLLSSELFEQAGFEVPTLKEASFSGLLFQFLGFTDQQVANVYQWNLFDGSTYVGTIYEVAYPTDTGGFQGYLNLRDEAKTLTEMGTVNEVNNYGDASFYFNHKAKVKTVHLLIRIGARLYGFEYAQSYHDKMKNVFDILKTVQ